MSLPYSGISRKADAPRRLVVSFHDLHPGTRAVCARFLERLGEFGVERVSLLVVPRWHGGPPVTKDAAFTDWLRQCAAAGHDICLHGFFHRADAISGGPLAQFIGRIYTKSEGEFFRIDHANAVDRIRRGLAIVASEAGLPVVGFTAPAWLVSRAARTALAECGMTYNTTFSRIELLQSGTALPAPTLVFSTRARWRRAVSHAWVRFWKRVHRDAPILRIAAHPDDFANARVEATLFALVRRAIADGRQPVTYRDVAESAARPRPASSRPLAAA